MVFVKVNAGLCNQLYRFAVAYTLAKEWDEELIIDCDVDGNPEWTYLLDEFNVPLCKKVIYPVRYNAGKEYVKMPPQIRGKVGIVDEFYFEQDGHFLTIPKEKFKSEFPGKDIYLKGSLFKRQMFEKYLPEIRSFFTLKEPSAFVHEFEKRIEQVTAVGVHIRKQGFAVLGDDNGMDFFMAAIVYMRRRYKDARFYIFSDELDYVKENLGSADDIFYMDAMNGYRGDIEEFVCLTKCHHYILTRRSTYGRMAEILNLSEQKMSVLFGDNTWGDSEKRFHFMSQEEVQKLSGLFIKRRVVHNFQESFFQGKSDEKLEQVFINIGLDSEGVMVEDRKKLFYQKARLYTRRKEYGQAVHLCRLLEEQYGENDTEFHEFFGDLLCKYGAVREAVIEYISASAKKKIRKDIFSDNRFLDYKKLLEKKERKHYLIVQYGSYNSQYLNEMQMIGLILARMGNHVSFIFKRDFVEAKKATVNAAMIEWNRNLDNKWMDLILEKGFSIGRFYYGYPCYEYTIVLNNKKENLQTIAGKYPDEETIVVGREPQIIAEDVPFKKVFVDFSFPFDEAYLQEEIEDLKIHNMYKCADVVVTGNQSYSKKGQKVLYIDENLLDKSYWYEGVKVPYYEPILYTDDYLDIALKIDVECL